MYVCPVGALVLAFAVPTAAQNIVNHRLSGPMVTGRIGAALEPLISPDGTAVLYVLHVSDDAAGSNGELRQLVMAPTDGSTEPVPLSPLSHDVRWTSWTPDGTRAVYVGRTPPSSAERLYSVPADGSASSVAFSPAVPIEWPPEDNVELTSDGTRVVYRARSGLLSTSVFSVPVDGSMLPLQLNGALSSNRSILGFRVSPSGSRVLYVGDEETNDVVELYSVPADGSAARIKISHALASGEDVGSFEFDPSGTRAVYSSHVGGQSNLYSAPVDGSAAPVRLNLPLLSVSTVASFRLTPDGTAVVYKADHTTNERYELFLVPIDGSAAAEMLTPLSSGGAVSWYEISPDGATVVYEATLSGSTPERLYAVRLDDGAIVTLHSSTVTSFRITPDSSRVVIQGPVFSPPNNELYSAPLDGSSASVCIHPFMPGVDVLDYAITADSLQVVYTADPDTPGMDELYRVGTVPAGTPVATKLNPALVPGGEVRAFHLAPDSASVVFEVDANEAGVMELLSSALAGAPAPIALSDPLPTGAVGDALSVVVRNGRVVYAADQDSNEQFELYGAPADGSAPPVKLSGTLVAGGDVTLSSGALSPDGSTVVYRADAEEDGRFELFSAPTDGSSPPVKLNGPLNEDALLSSVTAFVISPDGMLVAYRADLASAPGMRLHTVPIGGGPSVSLDLVGLQFEFTPDSTRLVFLQQPHLYSMPVDGSGATVDLCGPATSVGDFVVAQDSDHVVFAATAGSRHLAVNSIVGGALIDLSGALVAGGDAVDLALSLDGERVVYRADAIVNDRFFLYSVPIDGSANPLVLNAPLPAGADVNEFQVSPDGENVLYVAGGTVDRLHRVPVDGSDPAVELSALDFLGFQLTPDGQYAVTDRDGLHAQPVAGGPATLLAASADDFLVTPGGQLVAYIDAGRLFVAAIGGGPVLPISPVPDGEVQSFVLDGPRAVYLADQDERNVTEVYVSFQGPGPGPHTPQSAPHAPPSATRSVER